MAHHIEYSTTGKPHPYHLVRPSIWPIIGALAGGLLTSGAVMFMHKVELGGIPVGLKGVALGLLLVLTVMFLWWKDIIFETVTEQVHNRITEIGLRFGMALFIASEVMFFVAFFWAFFSAALFPTAATGYIWPPKGVHVIEPFHLPFLMTMILLLSGCTVTWAHHAILEGKNKETIQALGISAFLGFCFLCFQVFEYAHAHFGFTDGIYSSAFYMATGFHGFHVFVGTIFLIVCWIRAMKGHFTPDRHFGFEAAAWYWHFVDVVWLFLFVAIYWWGNTVGMDHSMYFPAADAAG
ncbi:MAG: cytochrome c oxidase subunit 3 [Alphaproteobacteria bacterium]|nr:cytochrome c oxidase subunit 3 [Alphaproteobacteria bacterium]